MLGTRALGITAILVGLGGVVAAPASAAVSECRPNVVCLYNADRSRMSQYSQYTEFFQQLSRGDVVSIWNRTPSAVYINYSTGVTSCAPPQFSGSLQHAGYGSATGIRISSGESCF
jgi:hypothetical protein